MIFSLEQTAKRIIFCILLTAITTAYAVYLALTMKVKTNEDTYTFASLNDAEVKIQTIMPEIHYAPIKRGDIVGEIRIVSDNETIRSVPIISTEDVECTEGRIYRKMNLLQKIIFNYKN